MKEGTRNGEIVIGCFPIARVRDHDLDKDFLFLFKGVLGGQGMQESPTELSEAIRLLDER